MQMWQRGSRLVDSDTNKRRNVRQSAGSVWPGEEVKCSAYLRTILQNHKPVTAMGGPGNELGLYETIG